MKKTIYLARHAKSAWDTDASTDFDRPLSHRGERNAKLMANTLKKRGWIPDRIISSPSMRTQQTCQFYCDGFGFSDEEIKDKVVWNKDVYAAYMVTLLQCITSLPESLGSVMLIGHNPSMEDLLDHLCGDTSAYKQNNGKLFTTGNVAKLTIDILWKDIVMSEVTLDEILRPKEL